MSSVELYDKKIKLALETLAGKPTEANYALLAGCYIDAAGAGAANGDWKTFFDCLKCVELMSLRSKFYNNLIVNKVIALCVKNRNTLQESEVVDSLFDLVVNLDYNGDSTRRHNLFSAFHWFSKFWRGYLDFCDWWDFSNFRAEDFTFKDKRDSLAESAYIAYSRRVANHAVAEYTFDFYIDFIDKRLSNVFTVYADYHIATFMLRVGFDYKDVLRAYRSYIKLKHHKPWSWTTLSHLFTEDSVERQACVLFAQECEGIADLPQESDLDYRKICHDMFAGIDDPDRDFWLHVRTKLMETKACGKWTERKKHKRKKN